MNGIKKIIGIYFLLGAVGTYLYYLSSQENIFYYFIPNLIATLVFLAYAISSYVYLKDVNSPNRKNLFSIIILIQAIQIEVMGYVFKSLYFPDFSLNIDLRNVSDISYSFRFFSFKVGFGHFPNDDNLNISINLLLIAIIFLVSFNLKSVLNNPKGNM